MGVIPFENLHSGWEPAERMYSDRAIFVGLPKSVSGRAVTANVDGVEGFRVVGF
jgi:hypothetical protein